MPGMDGFEVCRELRRAGIRTPIIFLTARVQEAEKILGLELGGDDGLTVLTYSAEPGTPSGDGLELLATWAATQEGVVSG